MIKDFLADFTTITKPSATADSFQPYFSMILTIIAITIIAYSFQTLTTSLYAYAANPHMIHSKGKQTDPCKNVVGTSLSRCATEDKANEFKEGELYSSFEHDTQSSIK